MFVVLDYFQVKTASEQDEMLCPIFRELIRLFQETVLANSNYKMVQYAYFFFCSLPNYKKFQQLFLTRLILNLTTVIILQSIYDFRSTIW